MKPPAPPFSHTMPCVMDIEASGFGRSSYPIEIGYALPDGRSRCMLVMPAPQWTHWDTQAEATHQIARDTLLAHGQPAAHVAAMLNRELGGLTVYCDGWAHDYAWLNALYEVAGLRPKFRLESVTALLPQDQLERLDEARKEAQRELGLARHRASNDARALQRALSLVRELV